MTRIISHALFTALVLAGCALDGTQAERDGSDVNSNAAAGVPSHNASGGSLQTGGSNSIQAGASNGAGAQGSSQDEPGTGLGTSGASGSSTATTEASAAALGKLRAYLQLARQERPALESEDFSRVPLTRADAETAQKLLWDDFVALVKATRSGEVGASESQWKSIKLSGATLKYYKAVRGSKPSGGWNLFISMHGGGSVGAAQNDGQWANQLALVNSYRPQNAIWIAPRAPIDSWDMWFRVPIDALFDRLISDLIVFDGVNPNRVYLTGYSAGGDGVYQLGPRMADRWAGAAMSAGSPNDARPENLRNLAFAIHCGANDTAYDRNLIAEKWGKWLDDLHAADPGGYFHQWQVHDGYAHWMGMTDAVSVPFIQGYVRNPLPSKVIWRQAAVTHSRSYWLAVDKSNEKSKTQVTATYSDAENSITFSGVQDLQSIKVRVSDAMLDLDQPVRVMHADKAVFNGIIQRTIATLNQTLTERGDPALMFSGELTVSLDSGSQ